MDLDTMLERFEREYLEVNSIGADRRRTQLRFLRQLAGRLDHPLEELTTKDVTEFIGAEMTAGKHPNTGRFYMGMIRSFITWASDAGLIDAERTAQLRSVRNPRGSGPRNRPNPYTVEEVLRFKVILAEKYPVLPTSGTGSRALKLFLKRGGPRLRRHLWRHARRLQFEAQVALALECGLRRLEIFELSIPAMHYDNHEVLVTTAKQEPGSEIQRAVPYTTHARNCVQEWLDFRLLLRPPHERPWLCLDYLRPLDVQLQPQTLDTMGHSLLRLGSGWSWHRFRHTAATEWLRSGVPLEKVRIFMGHADLEQTLAYAKIVGSDVTRAFGDAEADFAKRLGLAA